MKRLLLILSLIGFSFLSAEDYSKNEYVKLWHKKYFLQLSPVQQIHFLHALNSNVKLVLETVETFKSEFVNKKLEEVISQVKSQNQISQPTIEWINEKGLILLRTIDSITMNFEDDDLRLAAQKLDQYSSKLANNLSNEYYSIDEICFIKKRNFNIKGIFEVINIWLGFVKICNSIISKL